MRLTLSTLPQLAVLAKILCLLMVVMCGAVPAMVRSVSLYSTCSGRNVTVMLDGRVKAVDSNEETAPYQMLTTQSEDFSRKLYIFAERSKRYICINKMGKVVSRKRKNAKNTTCEFYEVYNGAYFRYRSVADSSRYLGFNKFGKAINRAHHGREECFNFIKFNPSMNIPQHNDMVKAQKDTIVSKESTNAVPRKPTSLRRATKNSLEVEPSRKPSKHAEHHHLRHSNRWKMAREVVPRPERERQQQQQQQPRLSRKRHQSRLLSSLY